ncbi:MAG: DciA family protein [bacterium]
MFNKIGQLLPGAARKANIEPQIKATETFNRYLEWVDRELGSTAKQNIKPLTLKNNNLTIRVASGSLTAELKIRERVFLKQEQKRTPKTPDHQVKHIIYRVG